MTIRYRLRPVLIVACGVAATFSACDKKSSPTSPGSPPGDGFVSLRLTAPERIPPGESTQLTAEGIRADGSAVNVSGQASWVSSNGLVVQITSSGLATAGARGESTVQVRHLGRVASAHILVLPPDTFRLQHPHFYDQ